MVLDLENLYLFLSHHVLTIRTPSYERIFMLPPTDYNRINIIVPKEEKKKIVEWCTKNRYTLTMVLRQALKDFFKKQGVKL